MKIKEKRQVEALVALEPKEIKPRETKQMDIVIIFCNGLAKTRESFEPVNFYDLSYNFKDSKIPSVSFIECNGPNNIFKTIHNVNIALEDVEKEQIKLKSDFGYIK